MPTEMVTQVGVVGIFALMVIDRITAQMMKKRGNGHVWHTNDGIRRMLDGPDSLRAHTDLLEKINGSLERQTEKIDDLAKAITNGKM